MHIGGNETTQFALTSEWLLLAQNPEVWAELKRDRSKVRFFVEEALRVYAPTQGSSSRLVSRDVEFQGVKGPGGLAPARAPTEPGTATKRRSLGRTASTWPARTRAATSPSRRVRATAPAQGSRAWSRTWRCTPGSIASSRLASTRRRTPTATSRPDVRPESTCTSRSSQRTRVADASAGAGPQNTATGLTALPVPPSRRSGWMLRKNSQRLRRSQVWARASRSQLSMRWRPIATIAMK